MSRGATDDVAPSIGQEDRVGSVQHLLHAPVALSRGQVSVLQQTIGNRAVGRLLQQPHIASEPPATHLLQLRRISIERLKARYHGRGIQIMSETPPQPSAQGIPVFGATSAELQAISATLSLLPEANYRAIPRIVVADALTGGKRTGGGSIRGNAIERLMESSTWRRLAEEAGWEQLPRIELTRDSFRQAGGRATGRDRRDQRADRAPIRGTIPGMIWDSLIHETGHFLETTYDIDNLIQLANFPNICYGGTNSSTQCGGAGERFADAYMHHFTSPASERDPEKRTIASVLHNVEEQYQARSRH